MTNLEPSPASGSDGRSQVIQERIQRMIRERLHVEIDDPTIDLFETGIIDSLGLVELLLGLETEFGIPIATDRLDIENFRSLERTTVYLLARAATADP
jgi:D-alanine--poly(phosphoribitol) ligase subunit 2